LKRPARRRAVQSWSEHNSGTPASPPAVFSTPPTNVQRGLTPRLDQREGTLVQYACQYGAMGTPRPPRLADRLAGESSPARAGRSGRQRQGGAATPTSPNRGRGRERLYLQQPEPSPHRRAGLADRLAGAGTSSGKAKWSAATAGNGDPPSLGLAVGPPPFPPSAGPGPRAWPQSRRPPASSHSPPRPSCAGTRLRLEGPAWHCGPRAERSETG
jgi:hypothetical protein